MSEYIKPSPDAFEDFYRKHIGKLIGSGSKQRMAHCPSHEDKTPSLSINLETGQFCCHSCGEKGNAITFAKWLGIPLDRVPGYVPGPVIKYKVKGKETGDVEDKALYYVKDGAICTSGAELCNFDAQIIEEITKDDGQETEMFVSIEGKLKDGGILKKIVVAVAEFVSMVFVYKQWGVGPIIRAGQTKKDMLREAMQRLSANIKRIHIFIHTGWRKIGKGYAYIHSKGAIGADDVHVELDPTLANYEFPEKYNQSELFEAAKLTKQLLKIADPALSYVSFAAVHLAIYASLLEIDFCLWFVGATGSLKSTIAALLMCFFGRFERTSLTSWESTENALEKKAFLLKDTLFVIDDYAPSSSFEVQRERERKAQRIIRGIGNRSGRDRLRHDLTSRAAFIPRCFLLSTGEHFPSGQSVLARMMTVTVQRSAIKMDVLSSMQDNRALLRIYMEDFIRQSGPELDQIISKAKEDFKKFRSEFTGHSHMRIPEMLAWLRIGFELGLKNLARFVDKKQLDVYAESVEAVFDKMAEQQTQYQQNERESYVFLKILFAAISQGKAHLGAHTFGGDFIGWMDEDFIYLIPGAAYHLVCKFKREEGAAFSLKEHMLHKMLSDDGFLVRSSEPNRLTCRESLPGDKGRIQRVLKLKKAPIEKVLGQIPKGVYS